MMSTVQAMPLYGCEVWADSLHKEMNRKRLVQVQRQGALGVAFADRTFLEPTVMVIAGVIPLAFQAADWWFIYRRKRQEK